MNAAKSTAGDRLTRRAARLDDPRLDSVRNPTARRLLVAAMGLVILAEAAVLVSVRAAPVLMMVLIVVVALLGVICLGMLKGATRGVEELSPEALDERQARVRGEVYALSYRIGFGLLVAELLAVAVWSMAGFAAPPSEVILAAVVVTFHIGLVLPTMVTATTQDV